MYEKFYSNSTHMKSSNILIHLPKLAFASMFLVLLLLEGSYPVSKIFLVGSKIAISCIYLIDIIMLKLKKHRLSLTPMIVDFSLRNFMIHFVFGIMNFRLYSIPIHFCWIFTDFLNTIRIIFPFGFFSYLKYYLCPVIFLFQAILECRVLYKLSKSLSFIPKYMIRSALITYFIGLCLVLKHKFLQLCWFRKSIKKNFQIKAK